MKKIIPIFFMAFVFTNCTRAGDKKLTCTDFKIGKFQLINKEAKTKYLIQRTADSQIEQTYDLVTNKKIMKARYYKISWKNDCEYTLILDTLKSQYDQTDIYINSIGGYNCSIKSITDDCAMIETKVESEVLTSQVCKLSKE
jgi:hypothetical protein